MHGLILSACRLEQRNMTTKDAYQHFVLRAQEIAISHNWIPVNWYTTISVSPSTHLNGNETTTCLICFLPGKRPSMNSKRISILRQLYITGGLLIPLVPFPLSAISRRCLSAELFPKSCLTHLCSQVRSRSLPQSCCKRF